MGGLGGFSDIDSHGVDKNYRGCLRDVLFNSVDVAHSARAAGGSARNLAEVTWDCSQEFSAISSQPISFLTNKSFIAFPPLPRHGRVHVTFSLKTRSRDALLLYHAGRLTDADFIATEVVKGRVHLTVNKGSGAVRLLCDRKVDDGKWHQIELLIDVSLLRITVDGHKNETRSNFEDNRYLDLQGHFFAGGISLQARAQAIHKGLASLLGAAASAGSVIGCMKDIKVNGEVHGFHEAMVTKNLRQDCVWGYPCAPDPCIKGAHCQETGLATFACSCPGAVCTKTNLPDAPSVPVDDVLLIRNLAVREGGIMPVTTSNIELVFDLARYHVAGRDLRFSLVQEPKRGELKVEQQLGDRIGFSYEDLKTGKVSYKHDGSETKGDQLGFEMMFSAGVARRLPQKLRRKYTFGLVVNVTPWNDPPILRMPEEDTIVMVENTQIRLTQRLLSARDKVNGINLLRVRLMLTKHGIFVSLF